MELISAFQKLPLRQLYRMNLYYIDIPNLGLISDKSVVQKISTKFTILIALFRII